MTPEKIIEVVCDHLDISRDELSYRTRKREIVEARQYCFFLINATEPVTFREIGELFSMNHSTVIHGIRNLQNRIDTETKTFDLVFKLLRIIEDYNDEHKIIKAVNEPVYQENDFY